MRRYFVLLLLLLLPSLCLAQNNSGNWLARVAAIQAQQPHWITPVATVTPLLEQEVRFDFSDESLGAGGNLLNVDGGKGVELIPAPNVEVIFNAPPYLVHQNSGVPNGFGNSSMLVKYRLISRPQEAGNFAVTAFLGVSFNTGSIANSTGTTTWTPTLAAGKGWGRFDVQSTLGIALPDGQTVRLGHPVTWNAAFQYHAGRLLWPELELNSTFFHGGVHAGEKQAFLTPGLVVGKIPLHHRIGLTIGVGEQIAVTRFHAYRHGLIFSIRMPF